MENKETFNYTYSAKEQNEINKIRQKYVNPQEDKMSRLRALDEGVTKKAAVRALTVGIIGALILGFGMSLAMTDFGEVFGMSSSKGMLFGIIIGLAGLALVSGAYPAYNKTLKKERKKIAPEIIRLTDELLK